MSFDITGRAPSKAEQEAEAAARREANQAVARGPDGEIEVGTDLAEDQRPGIEPRQQRIDNEPEEPAEEQPRLMSPGDQSRAEIAKAMRARRQKLNDFDGDATNMDNFFGDLTHAPTPKQEYNPTAPEPGVAPEQVEPVPRKVKLAEGLELPEDEVIALARKNLQADQRLQEADDLLNRARAAVQPATPPAGDNAAHQEDESDSSIDYEGLVEKLQLGDPKEAAEELKRLIEGRQQADPEQAVEAVLLKQRFRNDAQDAANFFTKFTKAPENKDVVSDPDAWPAIERRVINKYRDEIKALGIVAEDQIPSDPVKLADSHRYLRVQGHKVRTNAEVLTEAIQEYRQRHAPATQQPVQRQGAPRVEVDRTARRQNLPLQPSRSASPQPAAASNNNGLSRQAQRVMDARRARGFPVG